MTRGTLLVAAGIHTLAAAPRGGEAAPRAAPRALLIDGERIVWLGDPAEGRPPADRIVDLGGAWIAPAFVDAHVHATATGLALSGVDCAGAGSAAECLDRMRKGAARLGDDAVVIGTRWDDCGWPEGAPPTARELADACGGRTAILVRVDGHSCVVEPATLARLPLERLDGVERDPVGHPTGRLREQAWEAAWTLVRSQIPERQLRAARRRVCERAAGLGIASLHEMGHPSLSGLDDVRAWAAGEWPVEVLTWWAALSLRPEPRLRPGGDLFLDGAIGSGTAATSTPCCPSAERERRPGGIGAGAEREPHGRLLHSDEEVAAFFTACTRARRGAGVHAIGDLAIEQALRALEAAAAAVGVAAVRACRHRLEHVEMIDDGQIRRMARLGLLASVQPAFDALWGGSDGLYAARLGAAAALRSNPFRRFAAHGVRMAFGSDSTVTPLDPWGAVVAAERHRGGEGVDRLTALEAHTLGGRHAAAQDHVGALRPGSRADLAVWSADPLTSEDPRVLGCLATLVKGRSAFGELLG